MDTASETAQVNIVSISWNSEMDNVLNVAARGDLEIIRDQVQRGVAMLWKCHSEKSEGYVVTRLDPGPEFVIVAAAGSGFFEFAPEFLKIARQQGVTVRTHVQRKGLIRMWNRLGLNVDEYILRG